MARILLTLTGLLLLTLFWLFRPGLTPPEISPPSELPEPGFTVGESAEAVRRSETAAGPLKPDNHARIIWNPEYQNRKGPCSVVYLHGFSASYGEGSPLHVQTAEKLGCHLYIARLHGHGLRTEEPLLDMNSDSLLSDAGRALAIGNLLGEQVVLVGSSMGGMLSLHLASGFPDSVDVLALLSPLIEFETGASLLFDKSWGQRIMRLLLGEPYIRVQPENDDHARYWYQSYRLESLMVLKTMQNNLLSNEVYKRIHQPVFAGYFYKDEDTQDEVVSVQAIMDLKEKLATPTHQKVFTAFPGAEEHVISSAYRSAEYQQVREALVRFIEQQLTEQSR